MDSVVGDGRVLAPIRFEGEVQWKTRSQLRGRKIFSMKRYGGRMYDYRYVQVVGEHGYSVKMQLKGDGRYLAGVSGVRGSEACTAGEAQRASM